MNMMFDQRKGNTSSPDQEIIPVTSLEEVAMRFKNDDDNYTYEHFLVQVRTSKRATPPPFNPPAAPKKSESEVSAQTAAPQAAQTVAPAPVAQTAVSQTAAPVLKIDATKSNATSAGKIDKEDIAFLTNNADLLLQAGELELARNIYRALLKSGEASDIAYAGLAMCADREGLVDQAIQFAWDSVAFAPNQKGYQILAQLLVQQGRDQEASQALNRALKSLRLNNQEQAEYYKMIGNCQSRLGNTNEAESAFLSALQLNPSSDDVQSNLGSLYLEQGRINDAKRRYQDALAANASNDKAWVGLGLCFVAVGDKESAHEAFARSLEKNLRNSTAIFHLVKCAYEIKKYSTAEKMLTNYVEIAPVSPSLLYSLAGLQFHVGKRKEASSTAKKILQIRGDHQGAKDLIKRIESDSASA